MSKIQLKILLSLPRCNLYLTTEFPCCRVSLKSHISVSQFSRSLIESCDFIILKIIGDYRLWESCIICSTATAGAPPQFPRKSPGLNFVSWPSFATPGCQPAIACLTIRTGYLTHLEITSSTINQLTLLYFLINCNSRWSALYPVQYYPLIRLMNLM